MVPYIPIQSPIHTVLHQDIFLAKEIFGFDNKVIMGVDYYNEPYKKDFYNDREWTIKTSASEFYKGISGILYSR